MLGNTIITNSQIKHNKIRVRTVRDVRLTITGLIISKGSVGTILDYHYNGGPVNDYIVNFPGVSSVVIMRPDSPSIEVLEVE